MARVRSDIVLLYVAAVVAATPAITLAFWPLIVEAPLILLSLSPGAVPTVMSSSLVSWPVAFLVCTLSRIARLWLGVKVADSAFAIKLLSNNRYGSKFGSLRRVFPKVGGVVMVFLYPSMPTGALVVVAGLPKTKSLLWGSLGVVVTQGLWTVVGLILAEWTGELVSVASRAPLILFLISGSIVLAITVHRLKRLDS